jgi:rhodanese-related sulfurtransferase
MRITNVGGSLSTVLLLSAAAWAVRLLRANNILRPVERPAKPAARASGKTLFGLLSPAAFRLLLELEPIPFLLLDVRPAEAAEAEPLSAWLPPRALARSVHLAEEELPCALRRGSGVWQQRFGSAPPEPRLTLVFLCSDGAASARCAGAAAALGFSRCSLLSGGLSRMGPASAPRPPRCAYAGRHALAVLLDGGQPAQGGGPERCPLLLDVRRSDERALYGGIPGAAHLPAEQLPRALAMGGEEWARCVPFARPAPDATLILHSRREARALWAAQLVQDAGYGAACVLREGVVGWRFSEGVAAYAAYGERDVPPPPVSAKHEEPNKRDAGDIGTEGARRL